MDPCALLRRLADDVLPFGSADGSNLIDLATIYLVTMKRAVPLAVALVLVLGGAIGALVGTPGSAAPTTLSAAQVIAIAQRVGRGNGDAHPTRIAPPRRDQPTLRPSASDRSDVFHRVADQLQ